MLLVYSISGSIDERHQAATQYPNSNVSASITASLFSS